MGALPFYLKLQQTIIHNRPSLFPLHLYHKLKRAFLTEVSVLPTTCSNRMERGEAESEPMLQGDDSELSVVSFDEFFVSQLPSDETLAEELQLQEVLMSCVKTYIKTHHGGAQNSIISMERFIKTDQGNASSFHISIQGEQDRDAILKLVSKLREDPDDPKGKQLIKFPCSETQLGESSATLEEELYCSICMEAKPLSQSFSIKSCSHKYCASCIGRYIAAKVEGNLTSIGCPDPECKDGILEPEMCRPIIPIEVFDRWVIALCESLLGSRKFYCPYKDCSALLLDEGGDEEGGVITNSECPHCKRMFCAQCRVPWHDGIGCEDFQQLGEDEKGREDLMLRQLATNKKWQRCPHCRMFVEKTDGCKFMNCRCGSFFCYVCASPVSGNHFCPKCGS